jgi:hypothetical protein
MFTPSAAIANLKSQWPNLRDLDRAKAVNVIKASGASTRKIALGISVSESSLRHLLLAAQAPSEDRMLASQGKISTNELVRRAKAAETCRAVKQRETLEYERRQASLVGCKAICDWLRSEGIVASYGEQIVGEARRQLAIAEENNRLPSGAPPPGMPTAEIIQRCRPAEPSNDDISFVARLARWLALWAFYSMPDPSVRLHAIDLAIERQYKW